MTTIGSTGPRLLIVDDDQQLSSLLERGLRYEGFVVDCVHSGVAALDYLKEFSPDLALLDIGMPDQDGLCLLRELRRRTDVPIVMLTGRDEVADKVGALDRGADDYVAKPFALDELIARIRAVLRRRSAQCLEQIEYDDVRCDLANREVLRDGRRVELTAIEFELLVQLVRNAVRLQSRETLLRAVWGYRLPVNSNVVDVHVGHLRRKLGPPPLIETVRGIGYRLRSQR